MEGLFFLTKPTTLERSGHGDTDSRQEPQQVLSLPFTEIVHVSAAHSHTSMVSSDGEVYMCGSGSKGQLGTGNNSDASTPVALDVSDSAKMVSEQLFRPFKIRAN